MRLNEEKLPIGEKCRFKKRQYIERHSYHEMKSNSQSHEFYLATLFRGLFNIILLLSTYIQIFKPHLRDEAVYPIENRSFHIHQNLL